MYNCLQLSTDELEGQSNSPSLATSSHSNAAVHGASGFMPSHGTESGKSSVIALYIQGECKSSPLGLLLIFQQCMQHLHEICLT